MRNLITYCLISLACVCSVQSLTGQVVEGRVTYIAEDGIYTDIGTLKGVSIGDTLYLDDASGKPVLWVQSVSRKSSLNLPMDTTRRFQVGMAVFARTTDKVIPSRDRVTASDTLRPSGKLDSLWIGVISHQNIETRTGESSAASRTVTALADRNDLRGRVGFQFFRSADRKNPDYNYYQPGLTIHADLLRIQGSHYSFSTNTHIRKTYSNRDLRSANYPVRVYEMALTYQNDAVPYSYQVGRISSPVINGIGYFDGGLYSHRIRPTLSVGGFIGTEPDYRKSTPQTKTSKLGAYVHYMHAFSQTVKSNSTLAFSGQYLNGNIDREFVYLQNDVTLGSRVYVYQNAEFGINRSDLSRRQSTLEISNIYLMTRIRPLRTVSVTASYDARKNVFLVQTYKAIPDSLFDDALRQGLRGDISWRVTRQLTLSAGSSVRTRKGDSQKTWLHSAGFYYYNLFETQINVNFRAFSTHTPYTTARSYSTSVSRQFHRLYSSVSLRTYDYELRGRSEKYGRFSAGLDISYDLTRRLFATAQYEYSTGKDEKADRLFLELSYRF